MDERVDVNIEGWRQAFGLRSILRRDLRFSVDYLLVWGRFDW